MKKIYKTLNFFFLGAISTFAVPPFSFFLTIFFLGFGIYKISLLSSIKQTFLAGWALGFGWFLFGLYWIGSAFIVADTYHIYFMPFAVIFLPSLLAVFWGLAFLFAKLFTRNKDSSLMMIIVLLSLFEYVRAFIFTGFPWLMPSMVLSGNEYLIQAFSYIGSFACNLVVITLSVLPFIIFSNIQKKIIVFLICFIPITSLFLFSFLRHNNKETQTYNNQLVTIVQPNIEQKEKWNINKRNIHLKKLIELSNYSNYKQENLERLIIWPETSFAGFIPNEKLVLSSLAKKILKNPQSKLVVGLLRVNQNDIHNSLVFLNSNGEIIYEYDKLHLVPFGEYIPLRHVLSEVANYFSPKDFSPGNTKPNFHLEGLGDIITLICYEILFSNEIKKRITKKTNLLINITNDAWFGKTVGPHQHLALAKIKAVELGLPLVRVANTGISAFISPYGEEITTINLDKEDTKTIRIVNGLQNTPYKKFGEIIFFVLIVIFIGISLILSSKIKGHK